MTFFLKTEIVISLLNEIVNLRMKKWKKWIEEEKKQFQQSLSRNVWVNISLSIDDTVFQDVQ